MVRAASPSLSENEFDISKSLFQDGGFGSDADSTAEENTGQAKSKIAVEAESEEDEAFIAATQAAANRKNDPKTGKNTGAFQSMGLNTHLLKAIARKGFTVPTPIQRKTIPLIMDRQDVVGMARTGSGKTAAFVIPMIERLKSHSAKVGARAVVLSPSRELALQTLKVIKELGKGTDLRTTLLVGGDSLEEQFGSMASNPDIIIATPGRFQHLKVEMGLELSSVRYVVFDEADRLFEMGFAAQLTEIVHSLPASRQTLLFSATLPKSLVEFARAGLQDPKLVRLDAESKISPGLESVFLTVKRAEKEGALLHILQDIIQMPTGATEAVVKAREREANPSKKRKRSAEDQNARDTPSLRSTVVFAATKHHVEYLAALLKAHNYATSYVYGSLDQTARKMQVQDFRSGLTNILVVTDVAARGLDIPILANVINYDFPAQPKIFVHRVGRTARAGKAGWAYSLATGQDMPYVLDLQLFLSRKLVLGQVEREIDLFKNAVVVGAPVRDRLERCCEEAGKLLDEDGDLAAMRDVSVKGEKQYLRTRNAASSESVKRAKQIVGQGAMGTNMLFQDVGDNRLEQQRLDMLAKVSGFRPQETVFEIGRRGGTNTETADLIRRQRGRIENRERKNAARIAAGGQQMGDVPQSSAASFHGAPEDQASAESEDELELTQPAGANMDEASDSELELTFSAPTESASNGRKKSSGDSWQDSEHFMSYTPTGFNAAEDRGYGVHSGGTSSHFVNAAKDATMDLAQDESSAFKEASKPGMRWDKKKKDYVRRENDEDGSKGQKFIRGESGQKIPASFRSGRFDAWRKANKVERMPRVGELERSGAHYAGGGGASGAAAGGKRFKHKQERAPKEADKYRDDYQERKAKVAAAKEKRVGRFADGKGKSELRGVDDVRKVRNMQEKRRDKNARPSRKRT
ncbi:ATP-dependent RNA helicase dbp10 [Friedmanniomyces endolithicus]|uniref:RNA helicase n=1 Tax=Friedmanniomyces endolithicus TaxID=329885 RepID=A0AAN6K1X0_9PEZI|nr:ATP-dependent RNA helicase dbp10 [Friedmanniomyces endolithicus]KAK0961995.1 ATP-dependent RNA helicase dbp10 [Friedmanniomyces endolithicus]KAK1007396.1 ATP-dependent RNA helicase dbp10 [Friedmanniomyces endolithicus]